MTFSFQTLFFTSSISSSKPSTQSSSCCIMAGNGAEKTVLDGSQIRSLVEDKQAFEKYVDEKFRLLDKSNTGFLSSQELKPAVKSIGKALGLPPHGSSVDVDHIYDEVLNEFMKGKQGKVTKEEFSSVLRDIMLGEAEGLARDPIHIVELRGYNLENYLKSGEFDLDAEALKSKIDETNNPLIDALSKIGSDKGMPPVTDPIVQREILQPALQALGSDNASLDFVDKLREILLQTAERLKKRPLTIAHTEKIYDGKSISQLFRRKEELHMSMKTVWDSLRKDKHGSVPKSTLRVALDEIAPKAGLPPLGAVENIDRMISEEIKAFGGDNSEVLKDEDKFEKVVKQVLGGLMLQLEASPIRISMDKVLVSNEKVDSIGLPL